MKNIIYYILLAIIVATSFFNLSGLYSPYLNSDGAIHILMANQFSFPDDLYFWGQDRLGSLVPFLGFIVIKLTGWSSIAAVSIVHYLLLCLGFFFISKLFKTKEIKILLAILWFLPVRNFIAFILLGQPYGIHLSLLAIAIFFIDRIQSGISKGFKLHLYISIISLSLILAVWVSDIAIISIIMIVIVGLFSFLEFKSDKKYFLIKRKNLLRQAGFYHYIFWFIIGVIFISIAKNTGMKDPRYSNAIFNNIEYIMHGIELTFSTILDIYIFNYEKNIFIGLFFWTATIVILVMVFFHKHSAPLSRSYIWFWFFLIHGIVILILVCSSQWVYANEMSRRYFVLPYISFTIAFLLYLDSKKIKRVFLNSIVLMLGVMSLLSDVYVLYYPNKLHSRYEEIKELDRLGEAGIISTYWNSYISSVANPDKILATPHDSSYVRNPAITKAVLRQKDIYLIKDQWFTEFPEVTEQFNHFLKKSGDPFKIGGSTLCRYQLSNFYMIFRPKDLKYKAGKIKHNTISRYGESFLATPIEKEQYIIFGPFVDLPKGDYTIKYWLSVDDNSLDNNVASVDVSSNWGKTIHCSLKIKANNFNDVNNLQEFEMGFTTIAPVQNMEFRIYYYGNANLSFSHIELSQL